VPAVGSYSERTHAWFGQPASSSMNSRLTISRYFARREMLAGGLVRDLATSDQFSKPAPIWALCGLRVQVDRGKLLSHQVRAARP